MSDGPIVGPYKTLDLGGGVTAPWYMIPFDKYGACEAPRSLDRMLDDVAKPGDAGESFRYTDVFLFSHGWNNDWKDVSGGYGDFVENFAELRHTRALGRPYRPLLFGVFWPSIPLVAPWERAPEIAAVDPEASAAAADAKAEQERRELEDVAEAVDGAHRARFHELVERGLALTPAEAEELAEMLLPIYAEGDADLPGEDGREPTAADLLAVWRKAAAGRGSGTGKPGRIGGATSPGGPTSASTAIDLRLPIRLATVRRMKDRSGVVGTWGVGPLLRDILRRNPEARVHLLGHSYGCKVVLSALCSGESPRPVDSALLLQPAISRFCFAAPEALNGKPGGFRGAFERVRQPIFSTFSPHDSALTKIFQFAVRRAGDVGELRLGGPPTSRFAALGGYGPYGCAPGEQTDSVKMREPGDPYPIPADGARVVPLDGTDAISGHGDISNPFTWWALYEQVVR